MKKIILSITLVNVILASCGDTSNEILISKTQFIDTLSAEDADLSLQQGNDEFIEPDLKKAEEYFNRGIAKENAGDFDGALEDFNKAILLNPNYEEAYFIRGYFKGSLRDYNGALADYNMVIALNTNNEGAYFARGLVKIALGQKDSGCKDLSKAGELGLNEAFDKIKRYCN